MGKGENAGTSIFSFSHNVFHLSQTKFQFFIHILLVGNASNLDLSMSKVSINLLLCGLYRLTWVNVFYTCPFSFSVQPFTTQFRLFSILYRKHFENIVKKEKMLVTSIFSFLSQSFLIYLPKNKILIFELHLFGLV